MEKWRQGLVMCAFSTIRFFSRRQRQAGQWKELVLLQIGGRHWAAIRRPLGSNSTPAAHAANRCPFATLATGTRCSRNSSRRNPKANSWSPLRWSWNTATVDRRHRGVVRRRRIFFHTRSVLMVLADHGDSQVRLS